MLRATRRTGLVGALRLLEGSLRCGEPVSEGFVWRLDEAIERGELEVPGPLMDLYFTEEGQFVPMLLDRNVGVGAAIQTSIRACLANPAPMAVWGLLVVALLLLSSCGGEGAAEQQLPEAPGASEAEVAPPPSASAAPSAGGEEIVIGRAGKPIARLVPYGKTRARRAPGGWEAGPRRRAGGLRFGGRDPAEAAGGGAWPDGSGSCGVDGAGSPEPKGRPHAYTSCRPARAELAVERRGDRARPGGGRRRRGLQRRRRH